MCVCVCAWLCVGEAEWRLLTWFLFRVTKASDHCATQYHLGAFKKITSTVGIYSYALVQGKKHPFTKLEKKAGFHCALMAIPVKVEYLDQICNFFMDFFACIFLWFVF